MVRSASALSYRELRRIPDWDINALFEEWPPTLEEFLYEEPYLQVSPLSTIQFDFIAHSTQIYRTETLESLGWAELPRINEATALWGKGCLSSSSSLMDARTGKIQSVAEWAKAGLFHVNSVDLETQLSCVRSAVAFPVKECSVYRVTLEDGREVVCNVDHPFLVCKRHSRDVMGLYWDIEWIRLEDLSVGDMVAVQRTQQVLEPNCANYDELKVLGYLLGDGCCTTEWPHFIAKIGSVLDDYVSCIERLGGTVHIREHHSDQVKIVYNYGGQQSVVNRLLDQCGLKFSNVYSKFIPNGIFALDEKSIAVFLSALYATDGCVESTGYITYCSVSKELALGLQQLLHRIGVVSRVRQKKTKSKFGVAYEVRIRDGLNVNKFNAQVEIAGKSDKQKLLSGLVKKIDTDLLFVRVKSIDYVGEDIVYDLTVEGTHTYAVSGIVCHNSGKDFCSMIIMARIANLLLCLASPQAYYRKDRTSSIDMLNCAFGAPQAKNNFFDPFVIMMENSDWFLNHGLKAGRESLVFPDKRVQAFSGHSFGGALEGKNLICAVLDEIAEFKTQQEVDLSSKRSMRQPKYSAEALYDMCRSSIDSRFGADRVGKLVLLSFPRFKGDFIMQKYDEGLGDIYAYVSKACTWEVNPSATREQFDDEYRRNPERAEARYAVNPSVSEDSFMKNREIIDATFPLVEESFLCHTLDEVPKLKPGFRFKHDYLTAIHVDLGAKHDRAGISGVHQCDVIQTTEKNAETNEVYSIEKPVFMVDFICSFRAPVGGEIQFVEIEQFLLNLRNVGLCVGRITFDGWQSIDISQRLSVQGFDVRQLSVDRTIGPYEDLKTIIYDHRLLGGYAAQSPVMFAGRVQKLPIIREELKGLCLIRGNKVDHKSGLYGKDEADSLAGAIQGALELGIWQTGSSAQVTGQRVNSVEVGELRHKSETVSIEDLFGYAAVFHRDRARIPKTVSFRGNPADYYVSRGGDSKV